MINKNIDAIIRSDIESLITNQVTESRTLEYKEKLPGNTDDDKKEFLADISAFANTSGGDIIYGISEQRDSNNKTTGLPEQVKELNGINVDAEVRRLESILQDGLAPRISGLRVVPIDGFANGSIILIRVPKSWNSPHMVIFKRASKFFARSSAGKYQLEVDQIRSAFIASESLAERIRQFRSDRIAKIIADETPVHLEQNPKIVLHVLPLESFNSGISLDVSKIQETSAQEMLNLKPMNSHGWSYRYNFDGLCRYCKSSDDQTAYSYVQAFRNGCIESVDAFMLNRTDPKNKNIIPCIGYEEELIEILRSYLDLHRALEFNPPVLVMLSFLNVKGFRMSSGTLFYDPGKPVDRDHLLIPEVFVESYNIRVSDLLRPAFNAIWQSCGYANSLNYDAEGSWRAKG